MTKTRLLVVFANGITFSLPVAAKMYKWVDVKGTTVCCETIRPEYGNKNRTELDNGVRVIEKKEFWF